MLDNNRLQTSHPHKSRPNPFSKPLQAKEIIVKTVCSKTALDYCSMQAHRAPRARRETDSHISTWESSDLDCMRERDEEE